MRHPNDAPSTPPNRLFNRVSLSRFSEHGDRPARERVTCKIGAVDTCTVDSDKESARLQQA
jgi:hypothetical protein